MLLKKTDETFGKHTLATCLYSHYNMCNIPIYFCNIDVKHLQLTSEKFETLKIYVCNMRFQRNITLLLGRMEARRCGARRQRGSGAWSSPVPQQRHCVLGEARERARSQRSLRGHQWWAPRLSVSGTGGSRGDRLDWGRACTGRESSTCAKSTWRAR
jgi:hypothetical protein